jgi:hypothetical protein
MDISILSESATRLTQQRTGLIRVAREVVKGSILFEE